MPGENEKKEIQESGTGQPPVAPKEEPKVEPAGQSAPRQKGLNPGMKAVIVAAMAAIAAFAIFFHNVTGIINDIMSSIKSYAELKYSDATATAGLPLGQTAVASTATVMADQVDFNANYFCSTAADLSTDNISAEFRQWLADRGISFAQPIKTPYWKRMAETQNNEYLFIALINRGIKLDFVDVTDTSWLPSEQEPEGWADKATILSYGKIQTGSTFMLLVADRPAQASASIAPTNPSVSPGDPSLPGSPLVPSLTTLGTVIHCGNPGDWNIEKIQFTITYDPDGTLPSETKVITLSNGIDSISELINE